MRGSRDSADFSPRCQPSAVEGDPGDAVPLVVEEGVKHVRCRPDSFLAAVLGVACLVTKQPTDGREDAEYDPLDS